MLLSFWSISMIHCLFLVSPSIFRQVVCSPSPDFNPNPSPDPIVASNPSNEITPKTNASAIYDLLNQTESNVTEQCPSIVYVDPSTKEEVADCSHVKKRGPGADAKEDSQNKKAEDGRVGELVAVSLIDVILLVIVIILLLKLRSSFKQEVWHDAEEGGEASDRSGGLASGIGTGSKGISDPLKIVGGFPVPKGSEMAGKSPAVHDQGVQALKNKVSLDYSDSNYETALEFTQSHSGNKSSGYESSKIKFPSELQGSGPGGQKVAEKEKERILAFPVKQIIPENPAPSKDSVSPPKQKSDKEKSSQTNSKSGNRRENPPGSKSK